MTELQKALELLERDYLLNICMSEALRRGQGRLLYVGRDGVLMQETGGGLPMLSCESGEAALRICGGLTVEGEMMVHQEHSIAPLMDKYGFTEALPCYNAAYLKKELPELPDIAELRQLGVEYADTVWDMYETHLGSKEHIERLLKRGVMYGAFVDGALVGFVGEHDEGAGGLLQVLPEYRRRGIASFLELGYFCRTMEKGYIPFGQVLTGNEKSIALQKSLGLELSTEPVYWLVRD